MDCKRNPMEIVYIALALSVLGLDGVMSGWAAVMLMCLYLGYHFFLRPD